MHVAAVPFIRKRLVRVDRRAAALLRLFEQRCVMLLRRLELVRADDRFARIVAVAVAPRRIFRATLADEAGAVRTPLFFDRGRAVAAEVALVGPERLVLVEVLRREEVDGQRLMPSGAAPSRAEPMKVP